jgi:hypothetical protein
MQYKLSVVKPTWLRPHLLNILSCVENICVTDYLHFLVELTLVDTGKGDSVKVRVPRSG